MSPCNHPSLLLLNGMLASFHYKNQFGPDPWPDFTPIFSMSSTFLNFDILHPAAESWMSAEDLARDAGGEDHVLEWDNMYDERLLWRGSTTGANHAQDTLWWNVSQRIRLVEMATRRGGETRVLSPPLAGRDAAVGFGRTLKYNALNNAFMDVAFSGKPHQCDEKMCAILSRMFEFRKLMTFKEAIGYKYIMDVSLFQGYATLLLFYYHDIRSTETGGVQDSKGSSLLTLLFSKLPFFRNGILSA